MNDKRVKYNSVLTMKPIVIVADVIFPVIAPIDKADEYRRMGNIYDTHGKIEDNDLVVGGIVQQLSDSHHENPMLSCGLYEDLTNDRYYPSKTAILNFKDYNKIEKERYESCLNILTRFKLDNKIFVIEDDETVPIDAIMSYIYNNT